MQYNDYNEYTTCAIVLEIYTLGRYQNHELTQNVHGKLSFKMTL